MENGWFQVERDHKRNHKTPLTFTELADSTQQTRTCSYSRLHAFTFADAPWSYDCRKLLPIWDELGEKYQSHKDVIIAKIDVTANDVLSVVMDRYPFFRLFPAGPDIQVRNLRGWHSCMLMGDCVCMSDGSTSFKQGFALYLLNTELIMNKNLN